MPGKRLFTKKAAFVIWKLDTQKTASPTLTDARPPPTPTTPLDSEASLHSINIRTFWEIPPSREISQLGIFFR